MKKQRLGSVLMALFGAVFVQLCLCSNALAETTQYWMANGDYEFTQAASDSGGTFRLQQEDANSILGGTAEHHFMALGSKGGVFIKEGKSYYSTQGRVLEGRIQGDRFELSVRWNQVNHADGNAILNECVYKYVGTIGPGGYVSGEVWDTIYPNKKFGFSIKKPLTKHVSSGMIPVTQPKPLKSTGKAKTSSGGSSGSGPTAGANPAPWVILIGKWETQAGGRTLMMDLTQNGDLVEGRYDVVAAAPVNGSLIGRIAPDGRLNFEWKQSDSTGVGTFMPDRSCTQLQGGYTSQTPVVANGAWYGKRASVDPPKAPAAQVFPVFPPGPIYQAQTQRNEQMKQLNRVYNGKWVVKTKSGAEFTMMFAQNGSTVTGTYQPKNGKIDGTMANDGLLTYRWSDESGSSGAGIFAIYEGVQLVGTYSISQNPYEVAGQWAGGRQ